MLNLALSTSDHDKYQSKENIKNGGRSWGEQNKRKQRLLTTNDTESSTSFPLEQTNYISRFHVTGQTSLQPTRLQIRALTKLRLWLHCYCCNSTVIITALAFGPRPWDCAQHVLLAGTRGPTALFCFCENARKCWEERDTLQQQRRQAPENGPKSLVGTLSVLLQAKLR